MKVAFLDRDGTIVSDYADEQWGSIDSPLFLDGAIDALQLFQHKGFELIIITNQYIIGEGYITQAQYEDFATEMNSKFKLHGISIRDTFYCPHARSENCNSTKPNPGMLELALSRYPAIDIRNSFLVGDSVVDAQLANYFGMDFYGIDLAPVFEGHRTVGSLYEVTGYV